MRWKLLLKKFLSLTHSLSGKFARKRGKKSLIGKKISQRYGEKWLVQDDPPQSAVDFTWIFHHNFMWNNIQFCMCLSRTWTPRRVECSVWKKKIDENKAGDIQC